MPNKPMDQDAKARIMGAGSDKNAGQTQKGSFEARAQVDCSLHYIITLFLFLILFFFLCSIQAAADKNYPASGQQQPSPNKK